MLSFDTTLIKPIVASDIKSRFSDEISTATDLNGLTLSFPFISSPMDSIESPLFFSRIRKFGGIGVIHRFMSIDKQIKIFLNSGLSNDTILAIGINGDWQDRFNTLYNAGARYFCIDVANGFTSHIKPVIQELKNKDVWIMAGNVAGKEGYLYLDQLGVNAVRIGIGCGSVCTTRYMTGIGYPILEAIDECSKVYANAAIIADGGFKQPKDFCLGMFLGADAIMMGSVFAHTVESKEGLTLGDSRVYRGMASFSAMKDAGKNSLTQEGVESVVKIDKSIEDVYSMFNGGLRSCMSYLNAHNLVEMRGHGVIVSIPGDNREGHKGYSV